MKLRPFREPSQPMPAEFLDWQVRLRRHTALERGGAPHVGVAPLLTVRRPTMALGVVSHSIICGILPEAGSLERKTAEFRELYERASREGARAIYDSGLEYLKSYYDQPASFDPASISTLLSEESPAVQSLRAEPRCSLLFYVFQLERQTEIERFRCLQLDCRAEILRDGPVYENVWWHNALFHGKVEKSVVIRFHHQKSYDTRFGQLDAVV
jgi:hypothetical protein